jgi:membrane-associated phospholipid phosphatase
VSRYLYPFEREHLQRRRIVAAALIAGTFVLLLLLDRAAFHFLFVGEGDTLDRLESKDWYRFFRIVGTLFPWLFISAAIALYGAERTRRERRTGTPEVAAFLILASAALSGFIAEILQVVTGRLRPRTTDGATVFRGLIHRFENPDGLCFPSSHAAVAFGAAFMVWFLYPAPGVVALIAATACGLSRLLAGGHFLTDVFAAALLGYATARLLRPGSWRGGHRGLLLP